MALKELHLKILNKRKWQTICSLDLSTRSPKLSVLKSLFVTHFIMDIKWKWILYLFSIHYRNNLRRDFCSQFYLQFVTFRLSISELQNRQIKLHRISMPWQGRAVLCHVEPIVAGKCVETSAVTINRWSCTILLGPSPGWKRLLALSHLRHY